MITALPTHTEFAATATRWSDALSVVCAVSLAHEADAQRTMSAANVLAIGDSPPSARRRLR